MTRAEIGADMDMAQQSVHRLLGRLKDDGLVLFGRATAGRRGQPSPSVHLNARFACSLGISVNTNRVGVSCSDFAGGYKTRFFDIDGDPVDDVLDRCGATSQLSAERHRRWMTVTFFDGAGLRPSDQVSMSLLNVAGRELSFAVAISFSGCCLSRSSSMSLSDVAAA